MNNQRTIFIISAGAGIAATFLPYMKSFFNSVSLIETKDGTGYIIIIAFVISLIVSLLGDQKEAVVKGHLASVIVPGVIPGALLLLFALGRSKDNLVEALTNFEIGFYLVIIASLSILFVGLMLNSESSPKIARNQVNTSIVELNTSEKIFLKYSINKGELSVEIFKINKFPWNGDKVLLNGGIPPDGKYKIGFMNYLYVKNGYVINTTFI